MLRLLPANIASNCSCEFLQRVQQACIAVLFAVWAGESITRSHTGISVALTRMGLGSVLWVACLRYQRESDRRYVSCGDTRPRTCHDKHSTSSSFPRYASHSSSPFNTDPGCHGWPGDHPGLSSPGAHMYTRQQQRHPIDLYHVSPILFAILLFTRNALTPISTGYSRKGDTVLFTKSAH